MKKRPVIALVALVVVALLAGIFWRSGQKNGEGSPAVAGDGMTPRKQPLPVDSGVVENASKSNFPAREPGSNTLDGRKHYDTGIKDDPRVQHTSDGKHIFVESLGMAKQLHDPEGSAEEDLAQLDGILGFYRKAFRENPVAGDNQSVMSALMGDNPRGIVLFPSDHPSLNPNGELLDRWETPYYFHALSGSVMEIVSLGPDQQLGSDDDVIFTSRDEQDFFRGFTEKPDFGVGEE